MNLQMQTARPAFSIGLLIAAIGLGVGLATSSAKELPAELPREIPKEFPFEVQVVDEASGWPVPLVRIRTTHQLEWVTDNAGRVAIDSPELLDREVWLTVEADGYELPRDGFGFSGIRVTPRWGQSVTIQVKRVQLAQRLGRLTGGGIFAHSLRLGQQRDWKESGVFGSDSVQLARHRDRLHWVWGDTSLPHYPLGLFEAAGATTPLDPVATARPPLQLAFDYFRDAKGRPRNVARVPGKGPTWLSGLVSLPDESGESQLVAHFVKVEPPLTVYRTGLCRWNEAQRIFEPQVELWERTDAKDEPPPAPVGHAFFWKDGKGRDWVLFGDPFPSLRCRANVTSWANPTDWEVLEPQETVPRADDSGPPVRPHRGSIMWSAYRRKWVAVFCEAGGTPSPLGEIWYAESDHPTGPWIDAVKIATHQNYSFYNPRIDRELFAEDAPFLLFEGTYTRTFSRNPHSTPRYDYNQILYRLDYSDLPMPTGGKPANQ